MGSVLSVEGWLMGSQTAKTNAEQPYTVWIWVPNEASLGHIEWVCHCLLKACL